MSFSVVIPLYNKRRFVRRTIESVLRQDHAALEIIVVDDGSTDGSVDEIGDLQGPGFRICHQRNAGPGAARNHGFRVAQQPWVALLDGDDVWMPNHLSTLATLVREFPAADLVASSFRRSPNRPSIEDWRPPPTPIAGRMIDYFKEMVRVGEVVWTSAAAVRRDAFMQSAGFGTAMQGEDTEFWARMALTHAFAVSPRVTALYIVSTGGQMDIARKNSKAFAKKALPAVFDTIDKALADPRHAAKHADLRSYRAKIFEQRAKNALFGGDRGIARQNLALCPKPWALRLHAFRLLAWLPGPLLRFGAQTYSVLKSRHMRGPK